MAPARTFKPRILVVDDNPEIRTLFVRGLSNEFLVSEAANGPEGLRKIVREKPRLVLLDLAMPGMSGFDVLKYIKSRSSLPVIIVTAHGSKEAVLKSWQVGADDLIEKPVDFPILRARIWKLLGERHGVTATPGTLHPSVTAALDLIHRRYRHQLTLDGIASNCHLHPNYLCRLFKKQVGISVHSYLTNHRLSLALKVLEKLGRVEQAATSLGFTDPKYFSKVFSKTYGISPARYLDTVRVAR